MRRRDVLWIALAELNKCLYWFHPLAWIARHRLAAGVEATSDAEAARRLGSRTAYARALVEVAAGAGDRGPVDLRVAAVAMAARASLDRRVDEVLRRHHGGSRRGRIAAAAVLVLLVALAGTVELVAEPDASAGEALPITAGFDALVADLSHPDAGRRARAAAALAADEARWDEAIPHLVALLGDDAPIARNPRPALARSGAPWAGAGWTTARASWVRPSPGETATRTLAAMSNRATRALAEQLGHGDPVVRRNAAWGLGELRHPRGLTEADVEALLRLLDDADAPVRAAAAWSLGDVRVRPAIPRLIEALRHDADDRVRAEAAVALGEIRAADAEPALAEAAREAAAPEVRKAARAALKEVLEHGY